MGDRGDQFTDNPVAARIVRRDGHGLARFPTDGIRGSTVALAIDVASLATSSAWRALIWLRLPWPMAAMRSAQARSLGKPSSGAAADPEFCCKNQTGCQAARSAMPASEPCKNERPSASI